MTEQWQELKETITEMRDNDGTCTQQEACEFLANYMDVLEKQMQEQKTGHWIKSRCDMYVCSECGNTYTDLSGERYGMNCCPNCEAKMVELQESEDKA